MNIQSENRGFTLIEVTVALLVLAIALSAIIKTVSDNISNASYLRDKTIAHWVAMNKVTELHVSDVLPATGSTTGEMEMAGREWFWKAEITATEDDYVHKLNVEVKTERNDEFPLATLGGFVGRLE
ncbi:MAG: type II secretion system minor pseudopilin GspI [Gammaproteobacteria bacterium]|nr:type II secretion system minor pseudopilin GspI [Gammaproteobacteria bacterium]